MGLRLAELRQQLEVVDALPNRYSKLMRIDNSRERLALALALSCLPQQVAVLAEQDAIQRGGAVEKLRVGEPLGVILLGRQNIDFAETESNSHGSPNVNVHVEPDTHGILPA